MLDVSREEVTETALTNLVQAGAIEPDDVERGRRLLDDYSDEDLTMLLVISHQLREVVAQLQPDRLVPFLIVTEINLN